MVALFVADEPLVFARLSVIGKTRELLKASRWLVGKFSLRAKDAPMGLKE